MTAEIIVRVFKRIALTVEPALARESVDGIVGALKTYPLCATVAVVGHEPALSALTARLLGVGKQDGLGFEKGGAALMDLPDGPAAGGRLMWFLGPRILRILGASGLRQRVFARRK